VYKKIIWQSCCLLFLIQSEQKHCFHHDGVYDTIDDECFRSVCKQPWQMDFW